MKLVTYEIGVEELKATSSMISKSKSYFEETEQTKLTHCLGANDDFLKESLIEIHRIHQRLNHSGKVVIILPFFLTTSRSITLPVTVQKLS